MIQNLKIEHSPLVSREDLPFTLEQASDAEAYRVATQLIPKLATMSSNFSNPVPILNRDNGIILGPYIFHKDIFEYDKSTNLQELIEQAINKYKNKKYIIAINTNSKFCMFQAKDFLYDQLNFLVQKTYALEYIVICEDIDAFFVFNEDNPACFVSFSNSMDLKSFIDVEGGLNEIFTENMEKWLISTAENENKWIRKMISYFGV